MRVGVGVSWIVTGARRTARGMTRSSSFDRGTGRTATTARSAGEEEEEELVRAQPQLGSTRSCASADARRLDRASTFAYGARLASRELARIG